MMRHAGAKSISWFDVNYAGAEVAQLRQPPCWVLLLKDVFQNFQSSAKCFVNFVILTDEVCLAA